MNFLLRKNNAPTISWTFLNSVPANLTFTRASTATYVDSSGILRTATNDTMRFDFDPSSLQPRGLLIEESRTNLLTPSNDFSTWAYVHGAGSTGTETNNYAISPDGTQNASRIVFSGTNYSLFQKSYTVSTTGNYTGSLWMKSNTGTNQTLLLGDNLSGTNLTYTATPQWQSFSLPITQTSTGASYFKIIVQSGSLDILVYGAQVEAGAYSTSYIPTTTTLVTRAADRLYTATIPWFNAAQGTMFVQAIPLKTAAYNQLASLDDGTLNNRVSLAISGSAAACEDVASAGILSINTLQSGAITSKILGKFGLTYGPKAPLGIAAYNGTTGTGNGSGTGAYVAPIGISKLTLGDRSATSAPFSGWLQAFKYWNTALTPTQLKQATT